MRTLHFGRSVIGICAAAAMLAGCGASQPPLGAPGAVPQSSAMARSFQVLYLFSGGSDGANPDASLIDVNGTLYGTTDHGGSGSGCPGGCGTVYNVSTTGAENVLHSFKFIDGSGPTAGLIDVNGKLYGATVGGGAIPCPGLGCGTVYSVKMSGHEKVLHSFGGDSDGSAPVAGLIDVNGELYGTTLGGGTGCSGGCGTVYSVSTTGGEKILYRFAGGSDGESPQAALINVKGTLYGTTYYGGGSGCSIGCGTVYSISPTGKEKVLYRFAGGSDGAAPAAALIDVKGALYGTTMDGGNSKCYSGCGTVYSVSTSGAEKVLYRFAGRSGGANPTTLIGVKGTLYGTTTGGGGSKCYGGCGIVYRMSTTGAEKVLHTFTGGSDGAGPVGLTNVKGTLYGTTDAGGSRCYQKFSCGTVFALSP
ncbi:MAG: choice-of-anchor tandem repeat GloVer-containing protein [Candidatus Cybelea sp.]